MPRESVYDQNLNSGYYLDVMWSKPGDYVSLASVNPEGKLMEKYESEDGLTGGWTAADVVTPGWFVYLDRNGINDLIRKLRKARDTTFGRDE